MIPFVLEIVACVVYGYAPQLLQSQYGYQNPDILDHLYFGFQVLDVPTTFDFVFGSGDPSQKVDNSLLKERQKTWSLNIGSAHARFKKEKQQQIDSVLSLFNDFKMDLQ